MRDHDESNPSVYVVTEADEYAADLHNKKHKPNLIHI